MVRTLAVVAAVIIMALCVLGCEENLPLSSVEIVAPIDFGNGVWYFDCIQTQFGASLSFFIGQHADLQLVAMAPDDYANYGCTTGYFVYFIAKADKP